MRFTGQTILVTGASEGIGGATAKGLAREGAHVVMVARRPDVLDAAAAEIRAEGGSCETASFDVTDTERLEGLIADLGRRGRLDGLVNNAFVSHQAEIVDTTLEDWRRVFTVNVEAVFVGIRAALPVMKAQGGGAIVNIGSTASLHGGAAGAAYTVSKHGLLGLTRSTAWMYAKRGIRCNMICPGGTATNIAESMPQDRLDPTGAMRAGEFAAIIPGFLMPTDIANLALFLASDEAKMINGAVVAADGGWDAA